MKRVFAGFILVLSFAEAPRLFAQQPSSTHDQAVMDLIKLTKVEQQMATNTEAVADAMTKGNPMLVPFRDVIIEWSNKYLTWNAMFPEVTKLYKETFTESEIRQLIAFYQTPLGQKVLAKMPELTQKAFSIGSTIGQAHSDELRHKLKRRPSNLRQPPQKSRDAGRTTALFEHHNAQANKTRKDKIDGHEVVQCFWENQDQKPKQD